MKAILVVIAVIAAIYGVLSIPELLIVSADKQVTVFQQISARIAIGLSLLIVSVAGGLAAVISALESRGSSTFLAAGPAVNSAPMPITAAAAESPAPVTVRKPVQPYVLGDKPELVPEPMIITNKPRGQDAMEQAAGNLYNKPAALR